jgi:neutral ceramidase
VTATQTHSGPVTVKYLSSDAVVPDPDPQFLQRLENGIVAAAATAREAARPAQLGLAVADGSVVGGNRRDPGGPSNPRTPVLVARAVDGSGPIAAMFICNMHPTVLHEDSTLISGDFPAMTRQYLQRTILGGCPVICHNGPCGNQSPRHVARGNTFDEAKRLGNLLGASIATAIETMFFEDELMLECRQSFVQLPLREFPLEAEAEVLAQQAAARLARLRCSGVDSGTVRTAECDWFGAEETLLLARAARSGKLQAVAAQCLPAEIQVIRLGRWTFVGWPGEQFVEFALQVQQADPNTFIICLANGDLQGYLVTAEAVAGQGYEASNAIFCSPESGDLLVQRTLDLLRSW